MQKMNLYTFLNQITEEFSYVEGTWHEVNLKTLDKQEKTKLWNLFKSSYGYMKDDMIKGSSQKKFFNEYENAIILDVDGDKKMDAFFIYKKNGNHKKLSLLGANKTGAPFVIKKLVELLKQNGFFIEASLKIETILSKSLKPITDQNTINKVLKQFSNKTITHLEDGFYERKVSLSGKTIKKRIYGNI